MKIRGFLGSRGVGFLWIAGPVAAQIGFGLWAALLFFYRAGAYFLDAGFYVFAVASSEAPRTPELVQQAWGDSVFLTHTTISPMLVMGLLRVLLPIPLNFIGYLALQHGLLAATGLAITVTVCRMNGVGARKSAILGASAAVLLPLSNIGLGSLAYPHVEIFGSSAIALGITLLVRTWMWGGRRRMVVAAWTLLAIGVLAREDLGGHIAIATVAAVLVSSPRRLDRSGRHRAIVLFGFGAASTVLLLAWQRVVVGSDGSFDISYSGTPAYAHITSVWYLVERVMFMLGSRLDLVAGMVVFAMVGVVGRRREMFAFPLACLPWMILNVTAVDPNKHSLGIYGMFPMVVYLTAPLVALAIRPADDSPGDSDGIVGRPHVFGYLAVLTTLFLGGISGPPNGGGYIFHSLLRYRLVSPALISAVHDDIESFAERERIAVDDAVMSLDPVRFERTPLVSKVTDVTSVDAALFYPNFLLGSANVLTLFDGWIRNDRVITITCRSGGLVEASVTVEDSPLEQTSAGQFRRAKKCHPAPGS